MVRKISSYTEFTESGGNKSSDTVGCIVCIIFLLIGVLFTPGFILLSLLSGVVESCVISWMITILLSIAIWGLLFILIKQFSENSFIISLIIYSLICLFCSIHIISSWDDEKTAKGIFLLFPFIEHSTDAPSVEQKTAISTNTQQDSTVVLSAEKTISCDQEKINLSEISYIIEDKDGYVNLRSEPNINSSVIRQILSGEKVLFLSKNAKWIKVKYEESEGYIHESRLRLL